MDLEMMEYLPRATIHVLTFNDFDHIYKNLDSILSQTYGNIEIVIADDGSDSFPENEIHSYILEHKRSNITSIVILASKTNVGTVKNLNNAIRHSTGEIYIQLSQDDEFFSDDVVERIIQRYIDKPFNVLITSRCGVNKKGDFLQFWPHVKARKYIEEMNVRKLFRAYSESWFTGIASGSVMNINAKFIKEFGLFDEKYKLWEDGPFFHKCLRMGLKIETAYEIVAIKYEQTEGVSNLSSGNQYIKDDIELFLNTDFQLGKHDYGFMHSRYVSMFNLRRKYKNKILKILLNVVFMDVCIIKLYYSDFFRNWSEYDSMYV